MLNGPAPGKPASSSGEPLLSLQLRTPEKLYVPDVVNATAGGGVLLHLEIRNRNEVAWESKSRTGALLEIVVMDERGAEWSRQTRQLPMLAYPTRLESGRGFNLPIRVVFPDIPPEGRTYKLRIRVAPGAEETTSTVRLEPRT
jgi:hypothetical protein